MTNEEQGARAGVERLTDREFAAGIFLIVLGWLTFWAAADLPFTSSQGLGSGTLPKCLAIMIILLGVGQCVAAWSAGGARLARWNLRDIALILRISRFLCPDNSWVSDFWYLDSCIGTCSVRTHHHDHLWSGCARPSL